MLPASAADDLHQHYRHSISKRIFILELLEIDLVAARFNNSERTKNGFKKFCLAEIRKFSK